MSREIDVWGDWQELGGPALMGHLRSSLTRGKEVFSFCQHGAQTGEDLEELWRRIVFSIAVRNTDDHLRNHGFLLTEAGWMLSPAYDLNADPDGTGLSLNVSETDNALSFELALEVAPYFRLQEKAAENVLRKVRDAVADWERQAKALALGRTEQDLMRRAFA